MRGTRSSGPRPSEADPLRLEAAKHEREHAGGRRVEPLEVVDRDEDAAPPRPARARAPCAASDSASRSTPGPDRRGGGHPRAHAVAGAEAPGGPVEHGAEESARPEKAERRLRLRGLRAQDDATARVGAGDRVAPERRLAGPRVALEHERRRPLARAGRGSARSLELGLAADDLGKAPSWGVGRLQD